MQENKFITFEGGEGSGKSTQVKLLAEFLVSQGKEVVITREPGGTKNGEEIRNLLLNGDTDKWDGMTEVLLNFAARNEHVKKLIKPALEAGKWVLCDRFYDSTMVYQGYGQRQDIESINKITELVVGQYVPKKTFILDLPVEIGLRRAEIRGDQNRYERMGFEFHNRVRNGFIKIAELNKNRCMLIDASRTIEEIQNQIRNNI